MVSLNRVILIGNVVHDPAICSGRSGATVARFTIAVNRRSKHNRAADHIDVVAWGKLADTSGTFLKKGTPVLIEGRLATRCYESKSGAKRKATQVVATVMRAFGRAPGKPIESEAFAKNVYNSEAGLDVRYRLVSDS